MSRAKPRIIFYHLPRTAGSALTYDFLFPNFPLWRRIHVNYDSQMTALHRGKDPRSWPWWRRRWIQLIAGHMPFGFAQDFPGRSESITFVRDPIARAVSDYHFCRKHPANPAFASAHKLSLIEFAEADFSYVRNGQVRWLSNATYGARFANDEAMLEQALKNLAQMSFVGITEQFDASLERLCARYGLATHSGHRQHKNAFTPRGNSLSEEELSVLRRHNSLDLVFYEHCLERFGAPGRAAGASG
ncbi:MAG: sulfotransferase family 2 domain-containing protein [Candidatus Solibacter usitatus]|nr:sulfotransferase family 2 domain-containing protein [Candidatus Solibacter usitatus]